MRGLTIDAGGLIAFERRKREAVILIATALRDGLPIAVPGSVVAQVVRQPSRQVAVMTLLRDRRVEVVSLDRRAAVGVGVLLGQSQTTDVCDAHVVLCARERGQWVMTSDRRDLHRLDPSLRLIPV